jgi:hypothetical protein
MAIARLEANVAAASSRDHGKPRMTRMATTAGMAVRAAASITEVVIDQTKMESKAGRGDWSNLPGRLVRRELHR